MYIFTKLNLYFMKVTILGSGTSQGVPVIACDCDVCLSKDPKDKRLRTSIMVEIDNNTIVIDTGPDFRTQMLNEKVQKLDAVLFTHEHKDHVAGLDDVRAFNYKWKKDIEVYATARVSDALKREFHYVFSDVRYPGTPRVNMNLISNTDFNIGKTTVKPIEALHHKLPIFGYKIKNLAYLTDVSYISPSEKKKLFGLDLLIIDALRKEQHLSHFSLSQALKLIHEVKPKNSRLIHMSHYIGKHSDLIKELPLNVLPSYDGEVIFL